MKFQSDIDIDFADREQILQLIKHTPASLRRNDALSAHNTGVHPTMIPADPFTGLASLDYEQAEDRGYLKLDFINVNLYRQVQDEAHLVELMNSTPNWQRFNTDKAFFEQLIHVNNHWDLLKRMPEPVDTIPRLAMFLSVIRPAKRNLTGTAWSEVAKHVWTRPDDGAYYFKKSHAVAYAHLVVVNMNLISFANQHN
jgi:hypothetical protein